MTGSSIGAIIASTYALGQSADEAARVMEETSVRAFKLTLPLHSLLSNAGIAHTLKSLAIDNEFGQSAYLAEELYVKHGLTAPKMAEAALALLGK